MIFGSGEASPSGRAAWKAILSASGPAPKAAFLETPAGFELNSSQVVQRIADFVSQKLQNFQPQVSILPARKLGTPFSPDDLQITEPLLTADLIFLGPGSPSYAVRQLQDSLAWERLQARHRLGAALVFASAAAIAAGSQALPVYEIFKVGEDLHWKPGLGLLAPFGLSLVFIPHWNNRDGGEELDTSRCFMGLERFNRLVDLLHPGLTVVGIDELTALHLDLNRAICRVIGPGGVTLLRPDPTQDAQHTVRMAVRHESGTEFPLSELGDFRLPISSKDLSEQVWQDLLESSMLKEELSQAPAEVAELAEARSTARQKKDWTLADRLREQIEASGWQVQDTPDGYQLLPK